MASPSQQLAPNTGDHQHVYYREKKRNKYTSQTMLSLFAGILLGLILFGIMYVYLDYWIWIALGVSGITCLLLCIVFTMSRLCCCIAALVLPSMCTPPGRVAALVLLSGLLLDGPVTDIYRNMAEMSRSMGCSAEQSYNQSLLLLQPFDGMMEQLNETITHLQYAATDVKHGLKTLDDHMDDVGKHVDNGHVQLLGAGRSCSVMVRQAFNEYASGIDGAMNQRLGVMGALGTVYHHARDVLDRINPDRWASPRLQHLYKRQSENELPLPKRWAGEAIHGAINATKEAMLKLQLTLKFSASTQPFYDTKVNTSKSIYLVKIKIQHAFDRRTEHFEFVISVLKKICPIAVLILVYVAYTYIKQYVSLDNYDNIYVTKRFRDLDQKRANATGESLLPLKKYERNYLIDTSSSERNQPERGLGRVGICILMLHFLLTATCYVFDYIFYWVLGLINMYGNPGVDVTGRTSLEEVIAGEGIIAELLEVFLNGFHPETLFGYTIDPYTCLPRPHRPSLVYLLLLSAVYLALFTLTLTKAYVLRLRNRITSHFYGESEKARVIYLYNRLMWQRACLLHTLQRRVRQNHRRKLRQRTVSLCHQRWCAPCRVFLYPTVRCLVCGVLEDHSLRYCDTEQCRGIYCSECFLDLGQQCPLCRPARNEDYEEVDSEDTHGL
ncbi:Protein sneaky [Lamellibrachia satsuma]|nr:Protein sneaky [Lamellibrachia satsuma]